MKEPLVITKGVAVLAPKNQGVQRRQAAGGALVIPDFKSGLERLVVAFCSDIKNGVGETVSLWGGDEILVATESLQVSRWSKEVLDIEGKKVVLVPPEVVVGYQRMADPVRQYDPTPEPSSEEE